MSSRKLNKTIILKPFRLFALWEYCFQEVVKMVKGISRQVIVVQGPDRELFEQAIFILRDDAPDVTDEALLKEADRLVKAGAGKRKRNLAPLWAAAGAVGTGILWVLTILLF